MLEEKKENSIEGTIEIDFVRFIEDAKIHYKMLIFIVIFALFLGMAFTVTKKRMYSSSATMAVMYVDSNTENNNNVNYAFSSNIVNTFVLFLSENIVLDKVSEETEIPVETLKSNLSVTSKDLIISLSYKDADPCIAHDVLNIIMETAIEIADEKNNSGKPVYSMLNGSLKVFSSASEAKPIPVFKRNMIIAFVCGCVVAVAYLFLLQLSDRKYRDAMEIEEDIQLPVFASIPYYHFEGEK